MDQPGLLDRALDEDEQPRPRRWLRGWWLILVVAALVAGLAVVGVDIGRRISSSEASVRGGLGLDPPALDPHAQLYRAYARQQLDAAVQQTPVDVGQQFGCLDDLWDNESGWNPTAQNPDSTAYGIAQFLDQTWTLMGVAKTSDPDQQIDAGLAYIAKRYNTPCEAWTFWQDHRWY